MVGLLPLKNTLIDFCLVWHLMSNLLPLYLLDLHLPAEHLYLRPLQPLPHTHKQQILHYLISCLEILNRLEINHLYFHIGIRTKSLTLLIDAVRSFTATDVGQVNLARRTRDLDTCRLDIPFTFRHTRRVYIECWVTSPVPPP